ncbi:cytosolic carboxypeptidase-like protein 5 [Diadema antillarum]|uniref:cytosolic carboxypeptidase-like protein 5 n=1 Tax=Diadema antillarum TaxID=105358 RepID=UPI003A8484D0
MMEFRAAGLLFTSKFDSGNLARVERVTQEDEEDGNAHRVGDINAMPDYEFNLWTSPDCAGTEFENGNRTWFHFAVKGCPMNKLVKFNIMNMNKQGKLYSQGLAPVVKVLPQKPKWERIRDRPTHETVDGQFILSFTYRFEYRFSSVYFAFCYPYSYTEYQERLTELDNKFSGRKYDAGCPSNAIYYHRELLCHSLDNLRVDLVTISSCHGLTSEREPRLHGLFPDTSTERARKFKHKRVFFLSSRVHPGETPASFVFNGFLDFILRPKDERAIQLRKLFVFKLIPLLNPDGVQRGHYRTDQRGVNLNRVYLNPDPDLHPSIFAAKSVITHHHVNSRVQKQPANSRPEGISPSAACPSTNGHEQCDNGSLMECGDVTDSAEVRAELSNTKFVIQKKGTGANAILVVHRETVNGEAGDSQCKSDGKGEADVQNIASHEQINGTGALSSRSSKVDDPTRDDASVDDSDVESVIISNTHHATKEVHSNNNAQFSASDEPESVDAASIRPDESGIAFYVDLHGHASKRGCFMYGNHLEDEDRQVENLLYTKLISMNSAHFDFDGCNFTEKNMYTKDKRDGMSKEGSGRVAVYKATGITHSYTLECNYNSGRFVNSLAPASNDEGRATPPPLAGYPPKYGPQHYEEVGRATAVAALDILDINPWSRLAGTESGSVHGVRSWVQRYLRSMRGAPSLPKKMSRVASKTSSLVATVMSPVRVSRGSMLHHGGGSFNALAGTGHAGTTSAASLQPNVAGSPKRATHSKPLGPVRETRASIERRKHLASLQGTGISVASSVSMTTAPPLTTTTTTAATTTSCLTSGGKNFTIPLPLTHCKQSPPSTGAPTTGKGTKAGHTWSKMKTKSDSVLSGRNVAETTDEGEAAAGGGRLGNQRTLFSKSTNNLGLFGRSAGQQASSTLPSTVTELLNSVMINALDGTKELHGETEQQALSAATIAQQRTALFVKTHAFTVASPSAKEGLHTVTLEFPPEAQSGMSPRGQKSLYARHPLPGDTPASNLFQRHPNHHHHHPHALQQDAEDKSGDVLGSLKVPEDGHSQADAGDKSKRRRKKGAGPKRRSVSHSPSRKSQKNSYRDPVKLGKQSETDSDPERFPPPRVDRSRQRSLTSSLSDPTPAELPLSAGAHAGMPTNHDRRSMTPKRSRSISNIQYPPYSRSKVGHPIRKSNSFAGRDSSVSYKVMELNKLKKPEVVKAVPVKKIGFWVNF